METFFLQKTNLERENVSSLVNFFQENTTFKLFLQVKGNVNNLVFIEEQK